MLTSRRTFISGFSFAMLAGVAPIPATANGLLGLKGKPVASVGFTPGGSWNGTAGSGGVPSVGTWPFVARTLIQPPQPTCTELFQNWDTQVGLTTLGVDSTATNGGTAAVDVYCESTTPVATISTETWNTYLDPNGKSLSDYGWHAIFDAPKTYNRGVALGVSKPQCQVWFYARPVDVTMVGQLLGPFVLNPRPTRFDGTVNVGPNQTVKTFAQIAQYKKDNNIERLNAIYVENSQNVMGAATSTGIVTDVTVPGVYGITLTAAKTATFTGTISGATLTAAAPSSGTIGAGDSLCGDIILPNCVIAPYGTMGTTGTGGAGTYYLQCTSPDDQAQSPPNYTIASPIAFTTTKTAILGDGSIATWQPGFDGIRIEGAGVKTDITLIGYTCNGSIFFASTTGYAAVTWAGCETYSGTPNNNGGVTRTGTGAHVLVGGIIPQNPWYSPVGASTRASAENPSTHVSLVPGGLAESAIFWTCFISCYHHDNYHGYRASRLSKHNLHRRVPQPLATNFRTNHANTTLDSSSIAAGLRTFVNCWTLNPPSTGTSPLVQTTAGSNGQNGSLVLSATGGTTFTFPYTSATTLAQVYAWINGAGAGQPRTEGWSTTANVDTSGRSAVYMSLPTIAPSAHIPATAVPGGGLQMGTIIDVHSDILAQVAPAPSWFNVNNRNDRFTQAYGAVASASILTDGAGSYITDVCSRDFIHQDVLPAAAFGAAVGGPMSHFIVRNWTVEGAGVAFVFSCGSLTLDAYCEISGNSFESAGWSQGTPFTASFDGSSVMTVTGVTGRQGSFPNYTYDAGVSIGAIMNALGVTILSQLTITADENGNLTPLRFGTYQLSGNVSTSAAALRTVNSITGANIRDNVVRTGSVILNSLGSNNKALGGVAATTLYQNPAGDNYAPIAGGPLQMANGEYAGALNPDGTWKNAA